MPHTHNRIFPHNTRLLHNCRAAAKLTWRRLPVCAREPQAYLWEDDYHEVVTEDEDGWGREAMLVEGDASADASPLAPPPWLSGATTNAAAAGGGGVDGGAPGALRSAYSPEQGFRRVRTRGATAAARTRCGEPRTTHAPHPSFSLSLLSLISSSPACGGAGRCPRASFARAWRRRRRHSSLTCAQKQMRMHPHHPLLLPMCRCFPARCACPSRRCPPRCGRGAWRRGAAWASCACAATAPT
jgi:hypothetical protein